MLEKSYEDALKSIPTPKKSPILGRMLKNRAYRDRHRHLAALDFDPDVDIKIGGNGAWHWARPRPDLEDFLRKYFVSRAEDE